jgi:hypothetical protein
MSITDHKAPQMCGKYLLKLECQQNQVLRTTANSSHLTEASDFHVALQIPYNVTKLHRKQADIQIYPNE